jgi:hypothetical protein
MIESILEAYELIGLVLGWALLIVFVIIIIADPKNEDR